MASEIKYNTEYKNRVKLLKVKSLRRSTSWLNHALRKDDGFYTELLYWKIDRYPSKSELDLVKHFLVKLGFIIVKETNRSLHLRCNPKCIHVVLIKKHFGLKIDAHLDLDFHEWSGHNKDTNAILQDLSYILKTLGGGCQFIRRKDIRKPK